MLSVDNEVRLPITAAELDSFVDDITTRFELPPGDDTYDMIATMILHMPHGKAYASKEYFACGVWKSMSNKAAFDKLQELKLKREEALKINQEVTTDNVVPLDVSKSI